MLEILLVGENLSQVAFELDFQKEFTGGGGIGAPGGPGGIGIPGKGY